MRSYAGTGIGTVTAMSLQDFSASNTVLNSERKIEIAVALRSFQGEKEQDLSFRQNEKILVEQRIKGSGWLFGSIGLRKGWFPA